MYKTKYTQNITYRNRQILNIERNDVHRQITYRNSDSQCEKRYAITDEFYRFLMEIQRTGIQQQASFTNRRR